MRISTKKTKILLGLTILILATWACSSFQFGGLTPTVELEEPSSDSKGQETVSEVPPTSEGTQELEQSEPTPELIETEVQSSNTIQVTAWLGHIASLPQESQYDDMVILSPEGTGELGLIGATPEIEAEIRTLRDSEGPNEFVHMWGILTCGVEDYNGCQISVDHLQYGANYSESEISEWTGTIKSWTFNSAQSFVFELSGDYPMWYSIHASQDQNLQTQIESLRDTGAVVKVSGKLLVGIPDVNGTRIEVSNLEVVKPGEQGQPEINSILDLTADWQLFFNDRYNYQIKYPAEAVISLSGPVGASAEDIPEGMTPDEYMDSLVKEYTDRLCVRIEYSLGYIYIAAPPNKEKLMTPCGPTGLGGGEIIDKTEIITISSQVYQAKGVEFKLQLMDSDGNLFTGETLDMHGEMYSIELDDGTVFRFGTQPRHDATYEDYLMKTRDILILIMGTYESLQ